MEGLQRASSQSQLLEQLSRGSREDILNGQRLQIPRLPLGQMKSIPRSSSHRVLETDDEGVRYRARNLLFQARMHGGYVSPRDNQKVVSPRGAERNPEISALVESAFEQPIITQQAFDLAQQLKIRTIEFQGLRAKSILQKAKYQTWLLLSDRKINRQRQEIQNLQQKLQNIEYRLLPMPSLMQQHSHVRSQARFQKYDPQNTSKTSRLSMNNIAQIQVRMSKLKQIEAMERKTAQSLLNLVGKIKNPKILTSATLMIDVAVQTDNSQKTDRSNSLKMAQGFLSESTLGEENLIVLRQQNNKLKQELLIKSRTVDTLCQELRMFDMKMQIAIKDLQSSNKTLQIDRSRLATIVVEKEMEIEKVKNERKPSEGLLQSLEYENFDLKSKIQELNEKTHLLQLQHQKQLQVAKQRNLNLITRIHKMQNKQTSEQECQTNSPQPDPTVLVQQCQIELLRNRVRQQQEQIEEMSKSITELQSDLVFKQKQLVLLRLRKGSKKSPNESQESDSMRQKLHELEEKLRLIEKDSSKEMHTNFIKEQQWSEVLADRDATIESMKNQMATLNSYKDDLENTCRKMSQSLQSLKETNELLFQQTRILGMQKVELQQRIRLLTPSKTHLRNTERPQDSKLIEQEVTEEEIEDTQSIKTIRQIKSCLKHLNRLCDQMQIDFDKKDVIQQINKINDTLQAKLIKISFSPQFKKCMWEASQIAQRQYESPGQVEEFKIKDQAELKDFLDKSQERTVFLEAVEVHLQQILGGSLNSQLFVIIQRFLQNLPIMGSNNFLLDQIDAFLEEIKKYQQHIDIKFKNLEKSIGDYLQQAHILMGMNEREDATSEKSNQSEEQNDIRYGTDCKKLKIQVSDTPAERKISGDSGDVVDLVNWSENSQQSRGTLEQDLTNNPGRNQQMPRFPRFQRKRGNNDQKVFTRRQSTQQ